LKIIIHGLLFLFIFTTSLLYGSVVESLGEGFYYNSDVALSEGITSEEFKKKMSTLQWQSFTNLQMPSKMNSHLWIRLKVPYADLPHEVLYLQRVDHNLEIFVNGRKIYKFGDVTDGGKFIGSPDHYIDLPTNCDEIYLHIYSRQHTIGLYETVLVGTKSAVITQVNRSQFLSYLQSIIIFFIGLTLILFYCFYSRDSLYGTVGLMSIFFSLFVVFRSRAVYSLFPPEYNQALFFIHCASIYLFALFLFSYISELIKGYKITKQAILGLYWLYAFLVPIMASFKLFSYEKSFQYFAIAILPGANFFMFLTVKQFRNSKKEIKVIITGALLLSMFGMIDLFAHYFGFPMPIYLLSVGFFLFLGCNLYLVFKRFSNLNQQVKVFHTNLLLAYNNLALSEKKYRILVESSKDLIFTMDSDYTVLSMNRAMKKNTGSLLQNDITIRSILYQESDKDRLALNILTERLELMIETGEPLSLRIQLKSINSTEPINAILNCQIMKFGDKIEIMGRIIVINQDELVKYFEEEKQTYKLPNLISLTEDLTHRITRNLVKYLPAREINILRVGLREIIINSIEHGNLNISFEEKSKALRENSYYHLVSERQLSEKYKNTTVTVSYSITSSKAEYWISDNGSGFDYKDYSTQAYKKELFNGRGIKMAETIFDTIEYNNGGNTVYLVKKFGL
jgi:hypothetical protein